MLVDVTQNLQLKIIPVNNPSKTNEHGEQMGYYCAYVSHDYHALIQAQQEWHRGIMPSFVGYGSDGDAGAAVTKAITDYQDKFGPLCVADTEGEDYTDMRHGPVDQYDQ